MLSTARLLAISARTSFFGVALPGGKLLKKPFRMQRVKKALAKIQIYATLTTKVSKIHTILRS
jgi:hypothetical protein